VSSADIIAVTWEEHRRTRTICTELALELHVLTTKRRGIRRYLELAPRTARLLFTRKPRVVLVQSPSIVLAFLVIVLRPFTGAKVVIDAHNEAVEPFINPSAPIRWLTYWMLKHADTIIVTNRFLADVVVAHRGRPLVLPDPIPTAPAIAERSRPADVQFRVAVIATFASDEPLDEIFAAAATTPSCRFYVTGNDKKIPPALRQQAPANVTFTGFLPEEDYWSLIKNSEIVLDLTLIDQCLVCGGYEALAVGTPLLLSNNKASVELFGEAACYTENTRSSIAAALAATCAKLDTLRQASASVRDRIQNGWVTASNQLRERFAALASSR
jgi:glycosyltransferase involved in cell wall biosynthesis